jgi:hypothetical protein
MSNTENSRGPEHDLEKEQETTPSALESGAKAQGDEGEKLEEKPADPNLVRASLLLSAEHMEEPC